MIKKIKATDLKPGMFVHDLNCSWFDHPFFSQKFKIKDGTMVTKLLKHGITEVYIDTSKGLDVPGGVSKKAVEKELTEEMSKVVSTEPAVEVRVPFKEEIARAKVVMKEARQIANTVMNDVRMGNMVDTGKVIPVVNAMVDSVFRNQDAMVTLSRVKKVDEYTFMHSVSVGTMTVAFARTLNLDKEFIKTLTVGAMLHDVGKMKVPPAILNKPDKLTEQEFAIMKEHVNYTNEELDKLPGLSKEAKLLAAQHHERYDGTGYPLGLKGDEISIYGQMAAIIDVYDAITSNRCYHNSMDMATALRKILEWSKHHFKIELAHLFIRTVGVYPVGSLVRMKSGKLAVVVERSEKDAMKPTVRLIYDPKKGVYIDPKDINLSSPNAEDSIECHEAPSKWNIHPMLHLI